MSVLLKKMSFALAAAAAIAAAGTAYAGSATNTMTNLVTVADACDIAATGVDFGIVTLPVSSSGVLPAIPNTSTGRAATGNSGRTDAVDGSTDDDLALTTPLSAVNTVVNTAISTLNTAGAGVSGVLVVCTTTPTAITLSSANGSSLSLGTTAASLYTGTFNSKMVGVGGGATGSNAISYSLSLTGTPVSTAVTGLPVSIFSAAFLVTPTTGGILGTQTGNTIVPGYYADSATAQVDF
jgi:hypothetical protein